MNQTTLDRAERGSALPLTERLADEVVALSGKDLPDGAAHWRWLVTLGPEKLRERLGILREQAQGEADGRCQRGAAREVRLPKNYLSGAR